MRVRWRNHETGKPELLHMLNGSGPVHTTAVFIPGCLAV